MARSEDGIACVEVVQTRCTTAHSDEHSPHHQLVQVRLVELRGIQATWHDITESQMHTSQPRSCRGPALYPQTKAPLAFLVYSRTASSPRSLTCSMMGATTPNICVRSIRGRCSARRRSASDSVRASSVRMAEPVPAASGRARRRQGSAANRAQVDRQGPRPNRLAPPALRVASAPPGAAAASPADQNAGRGATLEHGTRDMPVEGAARRSPGSDATAPAMTRPLPWRLAASPRGRTPHPHAGTRPPSTASVAGMLGAPQNPDRTRAACVSANPLQVIAPAMSGWAEPPRALVWMRYPPPTGLRAQISRAATTWGEPRGLPRTLPPRGRPIAGPVGPLPFRAIRRHANRSPRAQPGPRRAPVAPNAVRAARRRRP